MRRRSKQAPAGADYFIVIATGDTVRGGSWRVQPKAPIGSFIFPRDSSTSLYVEDVTVPVVHRKVSQAEKNAKAVSLLDAWLSEDAQEAAEQAKALGTLKKALDADRLSIRKLFP